MRGHGQHFAPEAIHVVAVQARGARQELRGIRHVRRAFFVDIDAHVRMAGDERAGRTGMIQVDVRQQQRANVRHRDACPVEFPRQHGQCARWSGIDQCNAARPVQHRRRYDARYAKKTEVEIRESLSERDHGFCLRVSCTNQATASPAAIASAIMPNRPTQVTSTSQLRPNA